MAKSTSKKKRKPNPAIGDPVELLSLFERDVERLAVGQVGGLTVGGETAKEIVALVRQMEVETSADPKIWTAYDVLSRGRYQELVRLTAVVEGFFGYAQLHALPLFRAIHQQLALPPALAKKIDAANRYWSKTSLRFTKPAWVKSLRHVSGGRCYGPVLAYESLLKEARKHVALAKEALAAGVSHSAEATKTVLQAGPFRLVNTAHFSDEQMQQIGDVVREAAKRLTDIGLARVCYGDMLMSRQISKSNVLAFYMTKNDEMFVRGDVADNDRRNLLWTICHELGHRLQFEFLSEKGDALIQRFYASTKRQARLAKSEAHYFPAVGTKIETPIGELTFLGRERLGVVAYLDPKGQKRLTTTQSWQASMGAWDRHYGRGAESLFVSHYASKDAYESFAEMVAACATGKTKPAFVATLREILKADGIELLVDTDTPAQRGAELQASVTPHEYAAITETPEAAERREDRDAMRRQDQLMDEYAAWVAAERKRGAEDVPRFDAWLTSRHPHRKENPVGPLPEGLRFEKMHLDVKGSDRHQFVVEAHVPGREKRIGYVTYDVVGDVGYIDFVYIDPAYARRGVATAMYSYLAKEEPELLWDRGSTTDDGGHFRAATRDVLPLVPKPTPGFYTMTDGEVMEYYGADEEQLIDEYTAWADAQRKRGAEDVFLFETWLRNIRAPYRKANPVRRYYVGSRRELTPGAKLHGRAPDHGSGDDLDEVASRRVEDLFETHRPAPVLSRMKSVYMVDTADADLIERAGGRADHIYEVSPVGSVSRNDVGWWPAMFDEAMAETEGLADEATIGKIARSYFAGGMRGAQPTWEYRASEAVVVREVSLTRQQNPRAHDALSLAEVKRWEPLAASSGVSDVARGPSGFLTAYKRAGGRLDHLSEDWRAKREAFIARHMAQAKNERMFDDGLPTRRHLALIMWAYSPEAARLAEAVERRKNPVGPVENSALAEAEERVRSIVKAEDALTRSLYERLGAAGYEEAYQAVDDPRFAELFVQLDAVRREHREAITVRWNARSAVGLDPRTGKPRRPPKRVQLPGEGHYPDLLLPIEDVRGGCSDGVERHAASSGIEHTSCDGGRFHLFRYMGAGDGETAWAGLTLRAKRPRGGQQTATIERVFTDPAHRRKGYAAALLAEARRFFKRVDHSKDLTGAGASWKRAVNPVQAGQDLLAALTPEEQAAVVADPPEVFAEQLKKAAGPSAKVKWREAGGAREYMIVAHGQTEVRRIAAALTSSGATITHDFYADPERGYRALHLRLRGGEPAQVKTARMATLAYAAQGVDAVDDDAFRKICDLAAYADEGDPHAARRFDEIPVTELRSQIARQE